MTLLLLRWRSGTPDQVRGDGGVRWVIAVGRWVAEMVFRREGVAYLPLRHRFAVPPPPGGGGLWGILFSRWYRREGIWVVSVATGSGSVRYDHPFRHPGLEPGSRFFFYCGGEAGPRIKSGVTGWGSMRPAAPHPGLFAREDALQLGEEALAFGAFVSSFRFAEQFEEFALAGRELGWGFDLDLDDEIALAAAL